VSDPRHPFELLFAMLTQAMSVPGATVTHALGTRADTEHTMGDRIMWIPERLAVESRPFQLAEAVSQTDQASDFLVSIYGSTYWRVLDLHSALVAELDNLIGPEQGAPPVGDTAPAILTGTVDLELLIYPTSALQNLHLDFTVPLARSFAFPATSLASPQAIVDAFNVQVNARPVTVGAPHGRLNRGTGDQAFLELYCPTGELDQSAARMTLDPTAVGSACAALGFSSGAGNVTATGALPEYPYKPGYRVGASQSPGPRGGDLASSAWGVIVPVRLYQPVRSYQFLIGTTQIVPITAAASGGAGADDTLENPGI
jgi:hypothetical protein